MTGCFNDGEFDSSDDEAVEAAMNRRNWIMAKKNNDKLEFAKTTMNRSDDNALTINTEDNYNSNENLRNSTIAASDMGVNEFGETPTLFDERPITETILSDETGDVQSSELVISGSAKKRKILSNVQKNSIIINTESTATTAATNGERKRGDEYHNNLDDNGVKLHIQELTSSSFSILTHTIQARTTKRKKAMNVDHGVPTINNNDGNSIHQSNSKKKADQRYFELWNTRMRELASYKKEFGNTDVPRRYTKNKQLGAWVNLQRSQYKLYIEGKHSTMTEDRVLSLNTLGFN